LVRRHRCTHIGRRRMNAAGTGQSTMYAPPSKKFFSGKTKGMEILKMM